VRTHRRCREVDADIKRLIVGYTAEHGMPPTRGELAARLNLTIAEVQLSLERLCGRGEIRKAPTGRGIEVLTETGERR